MSIRYQLSEFYDDTLDRSQDFGFQVADTARRGLCSLWQTLPGALIPNPGDSFRRGAVSALCQDFEPPPAPAPPFTGGQCSIVYTVSALMERAQNSACARQQATRPAGNWWGPISGLSYVELPGGTNQNTMNLRFTSFGNGGAPSSAPQTNTVPVWDTLASCAPGILLSFNVTPAFGGQSDSCGDPDPVFPGDTTVNEGDTIFEGDTIVEGDRTIPITVDFSPTFEDDVCIGQFVFCADVEGNRVTLDAGGITINLPGTGGGDSGGGGGGDSETITNIDNRTTIIQQQQEDCCAAIQLAISQFRNDVNEEFNDSELRQACIVGLIRNNTRQIPRFEGPVDQRASGFSGLFGVTRFILPTRGDSCFLVINIEPTETFRGRLYTLRDEGEDVEGGFGHVEICFFDGGVRPASAAGIRVISSLRTLIRFDDITSGNQIRLSLKAGLNYSVVDPGFRWRPSSLPQCDELVDPSP